MKKKINRIRFFILVFDLCFWRHFTVSSYPVITYRHTKHYPAGDPQRNAPCTVYRYEKKKRKKKSSSRYLLVCRVCSRRRVDCNRPVAEQSWWGAHKLVCKISSIHVELVPTQSCSWKTASRVCTRHKTIFFHQKRYFLRSILYCFFFRF